MLRYVLNADGDQMNIVEKATGLVVSTLPSKEARKRQRFLNYGGGFNGFTPAFIMERIIVPS